ncbi:DUF411 domain-containing protein [Ghiorsea bivora]|uniref:DUF411 domain-containing protein n=1 Tax=Ghiorsea bivora TaxID=1485545 RepID=UPI00056FDE0D|nr:DUF411 domain-containing protein [Ghiorsea bivora]
MYQLKRFKLILGLLVAPVLIIGGLTVESAATEVVMYKNPSCGCCGAWAKHMRAAGFTVKELPREDMEAVKEKYGVSAGLASCHTALVDGYVIEGHVPASDVLRLLKDRPDVVGLTAPGMPMQSPGMQAEGKNPRNYDVLAFDQQGGVKVYHRYE